MTFPPDYYSHQYNARAAIPDHPYIYTRWIRDSAQVRRARAALLDLPYGESPEERLDFFPASRGGAPLLVFIHGGWWRSLDKSDFSFIVPGFAQAGLNVALTNYTLAPAASLEDIVRQQLRALAWLYRHADQYDFDPDRIIIAGHSAGAHLAAMMMAASWSVVGEDLPADLIKAGIFLSGIYDLAPLQHVDFVKDDLRLTEELAGRLSPAWMPPPTGSFITAVGERESDEFRRQSGLLARQWKSRHVADIPAPQANHLTICDDFARPDHPLHLATLALIGGTDKKTITDKAAFQKSIS